MIIVYLQIQSEYITTQVVSRAMSYGV